MNRAAWLSPDRMEPLGKPPASSALLPLQEPVAARTVALHSSNSNAGMKQYDMWSYITFVIEAVVYRKLAVKT